MSARAVPTVEQLSIRDDWQRLLTDGGALNLRIVAYLDGGGTVKGLARVVGVSRQAVYSRARRGGWSPAPLNSETGPER